MKILHIRLYDIRKPFVYFFRRLSDSRFNINATQNQSTAKLRMKLMQVAAKYPVITPEIRRKDVRLESLNNNLW